MFSNDRSPCVLPSLFEYFPLFLCRALVIKKINSVWKWPLPSSPLKNRFKMRETVIFLWSYSFESYTCILKYNFIQKTLISSQQTRLHLLFSRMTKVSPKLGNSWPWTEPHRDLVAFTLTRPIILPQGGKRVSLPVTFKSDWCILDL